MPGRRLPMEYNVQSKYQIIESPLQQLPHKCAGCGTYGTPENNKFIDFNVEVEFFGKIFFCLSCVTEMCNQFGWYSPRQAWALEKLVALHTDALATAETENKELKNAVAALSNILGVDPSSFGDRSLHTEVSTDKSDTESDTVDRSTTETSEDKSGSNESDHESGLTDVSNDDSIEQFLRDDSFDI